MTTTVAPQNDTRSSRSLNDIFREGISPGKFREGTTHFLGDDTFRDSQRDQAMLTLFVLPTVEATARGGADIQRLASQEQGVIRRAVFFHARGEDGTRLRRYDIRFRTYSHARRFTDGLIHSGVNGWGKLVVKNGRRTGFIIHLVGDSWQARFFPLA